MVPTETFVSAGSRDILTSKTAATRFSYICSLASQATAVYTPGLVFFFFLKVEESLAQFITLPFQPGQSEKLIPDACATYMHPDT